MAWWSASSSTTGTMFDSLLEEVTVPLAPGDLVVLFTDGISETMNREETALAKGGSAIWPVRIATCRSISWPRR